MGDKAAAAAERNHEGTSLGDKVAAAAKSEIMKGDKLWRQGGSGSQERNHEGTQAFMGDKAAAGKSEIMKGHKLSWETRQRQPRAKS